MKTREITISAILIALGVIIPMFTHYIAAGNIILPMHIPVLIAGLLLKPRYAVIVGVTTPILSSVLTGMPPAFPMLPIMIFELAAYALVASILFRVKNLNIYVALIISLIIGRVVALVVVFIMIQFFNPPFQSATIFIANAISTGWIGIVIQLIIIPPLVMAVNKQLRD